MSNTERYGKKKTAEELLTTHVKVEADGTTSAMPLFPTDPPAKKQQSQDVQVQTFVNEMKLMRAPSLNVTSKYGRTGQTGTLMTNLCYFGPIAPDRHAWQNLGKPTPQITWAGHEAPQDWAWPELELATKYVASQGTLPGLLTRMKKGLQRTKPKFDVQVAIRLAKLGGFRVVTARVPSFKKGGKSLSVPDALKAIGDAGPVLLTGETSAGLPWVKEKSVVFGSVLEWATKCAEAIALGKWDKFQEENPALFTAMVKNKLEVYERKELEVKTRPYYVFSAALTAMWACVTQRLTDAVPLFTDDPESSNAIGWSWNEGGATKLAEWIEGIRKGPVGVLKAGIYADDQIWGIKTADGKVYICVPDCVMMDMSLSAMWGRVTYELFSPAIDDPLWKAIFRTNCQLAFKQMVMLPGAGVVMMDDHLASGVPLTSYFDLVAAQTILGLFRQMLKPEHCKTVESLTAFFKKAWETARQDFGLEVKPETTPWYEWVNPKTIKESAYSLETDHPADWKTHLKSLEGITPPWLFLGMHIVPMVPNPGSLTGFRWGAHIPLPKIIRAFVYPKTRGQAAEMQRAAAERCRGLMFSGGYLWEPFAKTLEATFVQIASAGYAPSPEPQTEESETIVLPEMDPGFFPDREYTAKFMMGLPVTKRDPIVANVNTERASAKMAAAPVMNMEKVLHALQEPGDAWADISEAEATLAPPPKVVPSAAAEAEKVHTPPPVGKGHFARPPPNLQRREEKRKAYEEKIAALKALRDKFRKTEKRNTVSRKIYRGKGAKEVQALHKLLEEDFGPEDAKDMLEYAHADPAQWEEDEHMNDLLDAWDVKMDAMDDEDEQEERRDRIAERHEERRKEERVEATSGQRRILQEARAARRAKNVQAAAARRPKKPG